jgi:hypothetical protein
VAVVDTTLIATGVIIMKRTKMKEVAIAEGPAGITTTMKMKTGL